jgi:hypothetical protein
MAVSSTSMKVARVTVMAMSQGLWAGRQRTPSEGNAMEARAESPLLSGLLYYIHACMYL